MNAGFLSNPAPDSGYDAVMAALAPHAAPKEGNLGGTDPSVHNRVKQTFINPVATYPFIAARWAAGWEQSFHPGDLMFAFNGRAATKSSKSVILANLPLLNHIMASNDPVLVKNFQRIEEWNFIGIMRNSAVASGLSHRTESMRGGNRLAAERIINVDVRGSTRMFNYWEQARAGEHLHLAWRTCVLDDRHSSSATLQIASNDPVNEDVLPPGWKVVQQNGNKLYQRFERDPVTHQERLTGHSQPGFPEGGRVIKMQLLPYTEGQNYATDKIWWNTQSVVGRNFRRPICVGFVFQSLGAGETSDDHVAIRKATQMVNARFKLPMIHTFLHV